MADEDRFLSRWARRKRQVRQAERQPEDAPAALEPGAPVPDQVGDAEGPEPAAAEPPPDLPDPDTLSESADFTVFLKKEVPDALRRRALRRLWRLNPVFANLDGLNDYDEDYTDAARVVEGLKTLYQAGRGMVQPDEDEAPRQDEAETAAADALEDGAGDEEKQQAEENREALAKSPPQSAAPEAPAPPTHRPGPDDAASVPVDRKAGPSNALARRWGRFES